MVEDPVQYEVQQILDSRCKKKFGKRNMEYLIRFKGYGPEDDQWCKKSWLSCPDMLKEFHRKKTLERLPTTPRRVSQRFPASFPTCYPDRQLRSRPSEGKRQSMEKKVNRSARGLDEHAYGNSNAIAQHKVARSEVTIDSDTSDIHLQTEERPRNSTNCTIKSTSLNESHSIVLNVGNITSLQRSPLVVSQVPSKKPRFIHSATQEKDNVLVDTLQFLSPSKSTAFPSFSASTSVEVVRTKLVLPTQLVYDQALGVCMNAPFDTSLTRYSFDPSLPSSSSSDASVEVALTKVVRKRQLPFNAVIKVEPNERASNFDDVVEIVDLPDVKNGNALLSGSKHRKVSESTTFREPSVESSFDDQFQAAETSIGEDVVQNLRDTGAIVNGQSLNHSDNVSTSRISPRCFSVGSDETHDNDIIGNQLLREEVIGFAVQGRNADVRSCEVTTGLTEQDSNSISSEAIADNPAIDDVLLAGVVKKRRLPFNAVIKVESVNSNDVSIMQKNTDNSGNVFPMSSSSSTDSRLQPQPVLTSLPMKIPSVGYHCEHNSDMTECKRNVGQSDVCVFMNPSVRTDFIQDKNVEGERSSNIIGVPSLRQLKIDEYPIPAEEPSIIFGQSCSTGPGIQTTLDPYFAGLPFLRKLKQDGQDQSSMELGNEVALDQNIAGLSFLEKPKRERQEDC